MSDINTSKVDGNTVSASEFNQLAEIDNLISTSGQTPSTGNLEQQAIASARYSSAGNFFTDSGTANAYVLSPVSPFKSPVSSVATETYFNGMVIRFRAGNACSGASTVNVNNAGSKSLVKSDGSTALTTGDIPANTEVEFVYNGTNFVQVLGKVPATTTTQGVAFLSNPITISNNATDANNDIDFSAGNFQFSDGSGQAVATAIMTKRLDATWSAGTGNGGLLNGTAVPKAINSTYHCYKIYNPTTGVEDSAFLLGILGTAPDPTSVLPSGFTKFERRGSISTDSSGNIRQFTQTLKDFEYKTPTFDVGLANQGTSAVSRTLSVPFGIKCLAQISVLGTRGATVTSMLYSSLDSNDIAPIYAGTVPSSIFLGVNITELFFNGFIKTNLSAQIRTRWSNSDANTSNSISTIGYTDLTLKI